MSNEIYIIVSIVGKIAVAGIGLGMGYVIGLLLDKVSNKPNKFKIFFNNLIFTKIGEVIMNVFVFLLKYIWLFSELFLLLGLLVLFYIIFLVHSYEFRSRVYSNNLYIDLIVYMLFLMLLGYSYYNVRKYK